MLEAQTQTERIQQLEAELQQVRDECQQLLTRADAAEAAVKLMQSPDDSSESQSSDSSFECQDDSDRKLWEEVSKETGDSVGTLQRALKLAAEAVEAGRADSMTLEQGFYSLTAHLEDCVNIPIPLREDRYTLLHLATVRGQHEVIETLADDMGADMDLMDLQNTGLDTPVEVCSDPETLLVLLKCGASWGLFDNTYGAEMESKMPGIEKLIEQVQICYTQDDEDGTAILTARLDEGSTVILRCHLLFPQGFSINTSGIRRNDSTTLV